MSIFNGEFKKGRTVNLGGTNTKLSKSHVLQKAQTNRDKRRMFKKQDAAARIIQCHIRSYLDLSEKKQLVYKEWVSLESPCADINRAVLMLHFCISWIIKMHLFDEMMSKLKMLMADNKEFDKLNSSCVCHLFNDVSRAVVSRAFNADDANLQYGIAVIAELAAKHETQKQQQEGNLFFTTIFCYIQDNLAAIAALKNPSLRANFQSILQFAQCLGPKEFVKLFSHREIFSLLENYQFVAAILKNMGVNDLKSVENNTKLHSLANITSVLRRYSDRNSLSTPYIDILGSFVEGIITLSHSIDCQYKSQQEEVNRNNDDDDDNDDDNDDDDDDNVNDKDNLKDYTGAVIIVPSQVFEQLEYLYSKNFLSLLLHLIDTQNQPATILSSLYPSLFKLRPQNSKNVFVFIYLFGLPYIKKLLFHQTSDPASLNNQRLFAFVKTMPEKDVIKSRNEQFLDIFLSKSPLDLKFFTKDLYLFLEIFSYWLIISTDKTLENLPREWSNDPETFLSNDQFHQFIEFLKNLCLLLVWNSAKISESFDEGQQKSSGLSIGTTDVDSPFRSAFGSASDSVSGSAFGNASGSVFGSAFGDTSSEKSQSYNETPKESENSESLTQRDFNLLKKLCFKVMNQINLIDSRLALLDKTFWTVHDKRLQDPDKLLPIIAEEEERKAQEGREDNEDEDGSLGFGQGLRSNATSSKSKLLLRNQSIEGMFTILTHLPFFISFKSRAEIFQMLISLDRQRGDYDREDFNVFNFLSGLPQQNRIAAQVRRGDGLLDDAYKAFGPLADNFKSKISVTFVDPYGKPEMGIDGGGLTKEFLISVVEEGFKNPHNGIFVENSNHLLYPNPNTVLNLRYNKDFIEEFGVKDWEIDKLKKIEFLGKVIGKCLYEGILVDVNFVQFFLKKWQLTEHSSFSSYNDLNDIDPELYSGLSKLISLGDDFFESSDMTFSTTEKVTFVKPAITEFDPDTNENVIVSEEITHSKLVNVDLIPNGSNIPVTNNNKLQFITAMTNFKLNKCINPQIDLFLKGLHIMIPSRWLKMFNPTELQTLISGGNKDIDIQDFKRNVAYGEYTANSLTIKYFWECVEEMTSEERCKLLKFVTSVPRAPLLGFGDLNPKFGIKNPGGDLNRLPTSATCVNLLRIPDYRNKEVLRKKLLYVINADAGFDLS